MKRLFAIALLSAQIVFAISIHCHPKAVLWLRQLGGKLGINTDRNGSYWLLQGLSAVIVPCMTFSFSFFHPFLFTSLLMHNHQRSRVNSNPQGEALRRYSMKRDFKYDYMPILYALNSTGSSPPVRLK
jgi:hypothetical protein